MALQRRQKAEHNLTLVCEELRHNGINPEIKMYAGGLRKAVARMHKSRRYSVIVMPANYANIHVVKALLAALGLSHHLPPVALLPPGLRKIA